MNPNTQRAALWMIGAITAFTLMAVAGRAVSVELDTFEIMLYRSLIGVCIVGVVAKVAGTWDQVNTARFGLHFIRNVAHFTGQNLWFFAIATIPLAQVFALEFTGPIWVLLLSPLILREKMTGAGVIAAVFGFIGIWIVARPDFQNLNPGVVAGAAAAISFAITAILTRLLTRTDTITCIMVWLTSMQAVFGLICAGYDGDIALPSAQATPWLVIIGLAGLTAHYCLTTALSLAPATVVMPIDFIRLPIIVVVGYAVFGDVIDPMVILGGAIICLGNWINLRASAHPKAAP